MNLNQQQVVINQAKHKTGGADDDVVIDAQAGDPEGFDETPDGVWVRAWVWVPKEAIPGYAMTPPAPAAVVETITMLMTYNEFAAKYRKAYEEGGETVTNEQVSDSWAAYVRNPAGHFISK